MRRLRDVQGLTLEQLAERSGLLPGYIDAFERGEHGEREPSLGVVMALAKGFDVNPGELLAFLTYVKDVVRR